MVNRSEVKLAAVVTSIPAVIGLALLLANDWYFKAAFGNWFTGKLSDFAGIFLLSLLGFALLPRHKGAIATGIGVAFTCWKSPLVQPLIDLVHALGLMGVNRWVDYTDLFALVMVPLAWNIVERYASHPWTPTVLRRVVFLPMLSLSALSMVATTMATHNNTFDVRQKDNPEPLDQQNVASAIRAVADKFGLACVDCAEPSERAEYGDDRVMLEYVILKDGTIRVSTGVRFRKIVLPDGTQKRTRELQRATRKSLENYVGKVELRSLSEPPSDRRKGMSPLFAEFEEVFREVAQTHNLDSVEWSDSRFERAWGTLSFGYAYESSDTVRLEIWAESDDEVRAIKSDLLRSLEARFAGIETYSDRFIYFGGATLRESP